jgi:hypothetical protein
MLVCILPCVFIRKMTGQVANKHQCCLLLTSAKEDWWRQMFVWCWLQKPHYCLLLWAWCVDEWPQAWIALLAEEVVETNSRSLAGHQGTCLCPVDRSRWLLAIPWLWWCKGVINDELHNAVPVDSAPSSWWITGVVWMSCRSCPTVISWDRCFSLKASLRTEGTNSATRGGPAGNPVTSLYRSRLSSSQDEV